MPAPNPGGVALKRNAERVVVEIPLLHDPRVGISKIHGGNPVQFVEREYLLQSQARRPSLTGERRVGQRFVVREVHTNGEFREKIGTRSVGDMNSPVVHGEILGRSSNVRERILAK